ncbi:MAG: DUF4430 domain-containing protein [Candidatus Berkelbacteria bacterium]|nr:DUF4430 domain-containing protein [Candidatus Berkelbacteria bacterium]
MKSYLKFIKKFYLPLLGIAVIALIYFGVNGVRAELSQNQNDKTTKIEASETPLNIVAVNETTPSLTSSPTSTPTKNETPTETPEVRNIAGPSQKPVSQKVFTRINASRRAGNYSVDYLENENAFQLLSRITNGDIKYTNWGGDLGIFIDCIGGVCRTKFYEFSWSFYINGKFSMVGASNYIAQPNDLIEWKYEAY